MFSDLLMFAGNILGLFLAVIYLSLWVLPFLAGLLIVLNVVRYREWLAIVAMAGSMIALAGNGDFIYNLTYLPSNRLLPEITLLFAFSFVSPLLLLFLAFRHSSRRAVWAVGALAMVLLALFSMRKEFSTRRERDAAAYRQGVKPVSPSTGTEFVRWWRDYRGLTERILLPGHIPQSTRIILLTDPYGEAFQPQFCTGVASAYFPPVKDPAELGNATEVIDLKGCSESWQSGVAALDRTVATYKAIPAEFFAGRLEAEPRNQQVVKDAFGKYGYDPNTFNWSGAETRRVGAPGQAPVFITSVPSMQKHLNAFPCPERALLISVHTAGEVKAVLPSCSVVWHVFQLDEQLYLAALTQEPTPPGLEIMNPEQTQWLFRFEEKGPKALWSSP